MVRCRPLAGRLELYKRLTSSYSARKERWLFMLRAYNNKNAPSI